MNISKVDPAESYVRRHATIPDEKVIEELREEMGLNKSIISQYGIWLKKVVKLDFGISLVTGNRVLEDIYRYIKPTLLLVFASVLISGIFALLLSIVSVLYKNSILDILIKITNIIGVSLPNFWVGFLLLYLVSIKLNLTSSISKVSLTGVLLPAITMAIVPTSHYCRFLRANMLEEMKKDYILNCYSRGIKRKRIVWIHALKNAILPLIPLFFQNIGYLLIGSAIIEAVFSWPGLGIYTIHAIVDRDFPVIVAYIMLSAIVFSLCSIAAEIVEHQVGCKNKVEGNYEQENII